MTFLTLNGYEIPCANGGDFSAQDPTSIERTIKGTAWRDQPNRKRKWAFQTPSIDEDDTRTILALLRGQGHYISFDTDADSLGGVQELTTSVYEIDALNMQEGVGCVRVDSAGHENLFPVNTANGAETGIVTGWTDGDADITAVTGEVTEFQGAYCLKVDNAEAEVFTDSVAVAAGTYTVSFYYQLVDPFGVLTPRFYNAGGAETTSTVVYADADPDGWIRGVMILTVAGASTLQLAFVAYHIYLDGLQLESGLYASAWHAGGTTLTEGQVDLNPGMIQGWKEITIACWIRPPENSVDVRVFTITGDSAPYVDGNIPTIYLRITGGNKLQAKALLPRSRVTLLAAKSASIYADWLHVVVTYGMSGLYGYLKLYTGGSYETTDFTWYEELFEDVDTFTVGTADISGADTDAAFGPGLIDALAIYPYVASAAQITKWASSPPKTAPTLTMAGDLGSATVRVMAERTQYVVSTTSGKARYQISFVLEEV